MVYWYNQFGKLLAERGVGAYDGNAGPFGFGEKTG
jgi:hypothetical protein